MATGGKHLAEYYVLVGQSGLRLRFVDYGIHESVEEVHGIVERRFPEAGRPMGSGGGSC